MAQMEKARVKQLQVSTCWCLRVCSGGIVLEYWGSGVSILCFRVFISNVVLQVELVGICAELPHSVDLVNVCGGWIGIVLVTSVCSEDQC
uniref:Uncharacterized protein n=1 Tax=Arundo donax TaxID=35708 RepID=A0A0A9HV78_ARUDO